MKYTQYDKEKFKNAVLYIAKNGGRDVGKKKLAKILYFVDFTLFELKKDPLTGMPYVKQSYGPMPAPPVFYAALEELRISGVIDIRKPNGNPLERITAKIKPDFGVFTEEEKSVLAEVTAKCKLENAGSLERIAQAEPPYKMVEYGEEIPYYLAFYRNSFGEMDLTSDDDRSAS